MTKRGFYLSLPDDVLRKMNHKQYKTTMSWLRLTARVLDKEIDWEKFYNSISDVIVCGYAKFEMGD